MAGVGPGRERHANSGSPDLPAFAAKPRSRRNVVGWGVALLISAGVPLGFTLMKRHDDLLDVNVRLAPRFQDPDNPRLTDFKKVGEPQTMDVVIGGQYDYLASLDSVPKEKLSLQEWRVKSVADDGTTRNHTVFDLHEDPQGNARYYLDAQRYILNYISRKKPTDKLQFYGLPIYIPGRLEDEGYSFLALRRYDPNYDNIED